MNNITPYNEFVSEGLMSPISTFLKSQFNNIFKDANPVLNNLFSIFTKKIDTEKNVSNLYKNFIKNNHTVVQNEINKAESVEAVNKIITDNIKIIYFSLTPIIAKLQNSEFTVKTIFKSSEIQEVMSLPKDVFLTKVQEFVNNAISNIKSKSGLDKKEEKNTQDQSVKEGMMYNIHKILEIDESLLGSAVGAAVKSGAADAVGDKLKNVASDKLKNVANDKLKNVDNKQNTEDLVKYKKTAIDWINLSFFAALNDKMSILNKAGSTNAGIAVDQASKSMKGTTNDNAKDAILNKIMNMEKEELQKLTEYLGLKDLGNL